jgi:hypothetical protein
MAFHMVPKQTYAKNNISDELDVSIYSTSLSEALLGGDMVS